MTSHIAKPRLLALLVAIDQYASPVPPLQGCVHDLTRIAGYLNEQSVDFQVELKKLVDENATKAAIVECFQEHLGQANENDVVLFYYSGHGTQEDADPLFWPVEEDRKLESLVCYDSVTKKGGVARVNLLADKELRFLIHRVARNNPHIVTIFDCCHSGGNTRNAYIVKESGDIRERRFVNRERLSQAFPARKWEDFIFSDKIPYEKAREYPITELLPEGRHIQMAACQNDQSAFEVAGEGVFTRNLLDVLERCESEVTYYDLQSRIQQYIRGQFDQMPKIYSSGEDESDLFRGFLNRDVQGKPLYGNVSWNVGQGWIMDLGAMHGVSSQASGVTVRSLDDSNEFTASVTDVSPSFSRLRFEELKDRQPDTEELYKGFLTDYFSRPIGVYPDIDPESPLREELATLLTPVQGLRISDAESEADYCLRKAEDHLIITRPGKPDIPLIRPKSYNSSSDLTVIKNYLCHLSQFEFVKHLHNPNSYLFTYDPVEIKILKTSPGKGEEPVPVRNAEISLEYGSESQDQSGQEEGIRIALSNKTDRKIYCALLYLSFNFGVSTKLLKDVVTGLDPGREVWAADGAPIGLSLEEELKVYNYRESVSYLKLLVSTSDFKQQATRFEMPPLPKPTETEPAGIRGLATDTYDPGDIEDWTTRLFTIRIKNPFFTP